MQLGIGGTATRGSSLSVAYELSASERDWGTGWVPWSENQRHLLRGLGQLQAARRWTFFGTFEGQSGVPLTPIDQVAPVGGFIYGAENGIRSAGTARLDFGARYFFGGLWGSRAALGISVMNLAFGPVAPLTLPVGSETIRLGDQRAVRIGWERLFVLPPIPTMTFRMEF